MQNTCHLSVLVHRQAERYGDRTALHYKPFGQNEWKQMSWQRFSMRVKEASNALLNLGLQPTERLGIFSQNTVHSLVVDFAAFGIRAVGIPFYATSSEPQLQYIIDDAQIRFLFVGEQEQYDKARRIVPLCTSLERLITFDPTITLHPQDNTTMRFDEFLRLGSGLPRQSEVERLWAQATEDDIANILYTSGTTGDSKGVILTYRQYHAAFRANHECVPVGENDRVMNFLPYTHIFERGWTFFAMTEGAEFIVNTRPHDIQQSMRETHPTCMASVPRFWEKVYAGVMEKIEHASPARQRLFRSALRTGKRYNVECRARGKRPSPWLSLKYRLYDRTLFRLIRQQLGLEQAHFFPTAGATVDPIVEEFVHSIGIYMMVGYGLTESLATVSCMHMDKPFTIGSVGRPISSIEIRIGDNDEILLKGPTITRGYYQRDELNRQAFDADGFFHTGDAGYLSNGELFLKERLKDLYKTSNGKYIAPQTIEARLLVDRYIEQIAIVADNRKFVSALIVPDYEALEEYAKQKGITYTDRAQLCSNGDINAMMAERLDTLQQALAGYEQVKRFTLMPEPFTAEKGELTNTLKIRRTVLLKNYKDIIDKMYE